MNFEMNGKRNGRKNEGEKEEEEEEHPAMSQALPVPAGTTWTDPTDGPWESFGDSVTVQVGTITLVGGNVMVRQGSAYDEPGYSATDAAGDDATGQVVVDNPIDVNVPGDYNITYTLPTVPGTPPQTRTATVVEFNLPDSRQQLKTLLEEAYEVLGFNKITVYAYPPDILKAPAVVIEGFDPWIVPSSMGGKQRHYRFNYSLRCIINRTLPETVYNNLEALVLTTMDILIGERWKAIEADQPAMVSIGNVEQAQSVISVTALLERGTL